MKKLIDYILSNIKTEFYREIKNADDDIRQYYCFIITDKGFSTKVKDKRKKFKDCASLFESYAEKYGLDNFCLTIVAPQGKKRLFTSEWTYLLINNYLTEANIYNVFRMVGSNTVSPKGDVIYVKGDFLGKEYYMDEISFRYFHDQVCYIPASADVNNSDTWYTRNMLVELCSGNKQLAQEVFKKLFGERPESYTTFS